MESRSDPSNEDRERLGLELRAAEWAAATPYVSYPPAPRWYAPTVGAWVAVFLGVLNQWREGSSFVMGLALVGLVMLELGFIRWMQERHGAMPWPGRGTPPPEIKRLWHRYFAGCLLVVVFLVVLWWQLGIAVTTIAAFVFVTTGLLWYERAYLVAADAVRARLA